MEEKQQLTGNDFIDAYNLGVEAGKQLQKGNYEDSRGSWYDMYAQRNEAEKRVVELEAELEKAKAKVAKLKKKLKRKGL